MGRIFPWGQVERQAVPTPNDFTVVLERLKREVVRQEAITAAVVCGSVTRGDQTRRSDIDCVVVHNAHLAHAAFQTMQQMSLFAARRYVPLNFIISDTLLHPTRMHHFGPSFVEHIVRSMKHGLLKGDPLQGLAPSVAREQGVEEYLRFKMHYLQAHWAQFPALDEVDKMVVLTKAFEAPTHVARKVLAWHGPLVGDSKLQIRQGYAARMSQDLAVHLRDLVELDEEYSQELERQLIRLRRAKYDALLGNMVEHVPYVLEFMQKNLLYVDQART